MRRKSTGPKESTNSFDVLNDIDPEKLKLFAAVCMTWNYIETVLDSCLGYALKIDVEMFGEVSSRINGIDGKIALIKKALEVGRVDGSSALSLRKTLNAVEVYKKYRDGVVHVRISSPLLDVADTIQKRGVTDEVLISNEALEALYQRFSFLGNEMIQLFMLLHHCAMADIATTEHRKRQDEERAQQSLARLLSYQTQREALPPFPKFPDDPPVLQG